MKNNFNKKNFALGNGLLLFEAELQRCHSVTNMQNSALIKMETELCFFCSLSLDNLLLLLLLILQLQ